MKKITFITIVALLSFACAKDKIDPEQNGNEPVSGLTIKYVTYNSAVIEGYVNTTPSVQGTGAGIIISTSANPTIQNGTIYNIFELDKDNKFHIKVTNLTADTMYYLKSFTTENGKPVFGKVRNFATDIFEFKAVDLGLSVKWSNVNLGASVPEETGQFYAWGETRSKETFTDENYRFFSNGTSNIHKYNNTMLYAFSEHQIDNKTVLDPEDDAATMELRGRWRIPTEEEWNELKNNCKVEWTTVGNVTGALFTGKTGNSIFIRGYNEGFSHPDGALHGKYWTSSLSEDIPIYAKLININDLTIKSSQATRFWGYNIRPVSE